MQVSRALAKPFVLLYTVVTARRALLAALVLGLALTFVVPPVLKFGLKVVFPPQTKSKMLGLVKKRVPSRTARVTYGFLLISAWVVAGKLVYVRFKRHIPDGITGAGELSERWAVEADEIASVDPARSRRLYMAARWLAVDTRQERILTKVLTNSESGGGAPSEVAIQAVNSSTKGPGKRYRIESELGRGAMGVVYRATDLTLDRVVALKELPAKLAADVQYVERFRREARALARLTHPNIVQVYDLIERDGRIWMALEFVEGGTLEDLLEKEGALSFDWAASVISQAANGLQLAHSRGICHRDIKPGNILLTGDGAAKVSDFGIAKLAQSTALTQDGATLGSPAYMSPEQCSGGQVDHRTDIYALGITFYQLLTGKAPFEGDVGSVLAQHVVNEPASLAGLVDGIPEQLERVVMKMLAKAPEERQQGMGEIAQHLQDYVAGRPSFREAETGASRSPDRDS